MQKIYFAFAVISAKSTKQGFKPCSGVLPVDDAIILDGSFKNKAYFLIKILFKEPFDKVIKILSWAPLRNCKVIEIIIEL